MSIYTLVVNANSHDSSICLLEEESIVFFTSFERSTRKKQDSNINLSFVDYIAKNITNKIDLCVVSGASVCKLLHNIDIKQELKKCFIESGIRCKMLISTEKNTPYGDNNYDFKKLYFSNEISDEYTHHDIHAISSFSMSKFEDAVCLIIDGGGSKNNFRHKYSEDWFLFNETTTILEIDNVYNRKYLYKRFFLQEQPDASQKIVNFFSKLKFLTEYSTNFDIGKIYSEITSTLGYKENAGKVMGLSAYGNPFNSLPPILADGTTWSNKNLLVQKIKMVRKKEQVFFNTSGFNIIYPELINMSFEKKADMAYNLQKALEVVFLKHAKFIHENSSKRNLVISGGCALNILGISAIKQKYPDFQIFVDPIATDATQSIGLGIHYYNKVFKKHNLKKSNAFSSVYLGPVYSKEQMRKEIQQFVDSENSSKV